MKNKYVSPVSEIFSAEMNQVICASVSLNGVVGQDGNFADEKPNNNGMPDFGGYIDGDDEGPASSSKELDLWGDFEW